MKFSLFSSAAGPNSDRLTVDCDGPTVHWHTSAQYYSERVFLGAVCDGAVEEVMNYRNSVYRAVSSKYFQWGQSMP